MKQNYLKILENTWKYLKYSRFYNEETQEEDNRTAKSFNSEIFQGHN